MSPARVGGEERDVPPLSPYPNCLLQTPFHGRGIFFPTEIGATWRYCQATCGLLAHRLKNSSLSITGQERKRHFGLTRVDPERPCPAILKSTPRSSTTGLVRRYEVRHLTSSEVKALSSFPPAFRIEGRFVDKWARVGNSVPPLFMRAIAGHIRTKIPARVSSCSNESYPRAGPFLT